MSYGKVFISSTFEEFAAQRPVLHNAFRSWGFESLELEAGLSGHGSNEERCRNGIRCADLVICLIGRHYGSLFPNSRPPQSIVEWEYSVAVGPGGPWTYVYLKKDLQQVDALQIDPRQKEFVRRVTGFAARPSPGYFQNEAELVANLASHATTWVAHYEEKRHKAMRREHAKGLKRSSLLIYGVTGASLAAAAAAYLGGWVSPSAAVGMFAVVAMMGAGGMLLNASFREGGT